ncbi:hypothetical protein HOF65_02590 [bacterium]|jgi:2,3,4,5-tetrahydropyridine-2-carboxylate N-succinyltransferase|nr:hypothetical protein [bacterium]MBT4633676.1 hypothetical protein [bacterium]MBT5491592.1 hypothetical protein [bacterium]
MEICNEYPVTKSLDNKLLWPFNATIFFIHSEYEYEAKPFSIAGKESKAGQNEGTAKILAFSIDNGLNLQDTLLLFGDFFQEVNDDPEGVEHENIRLLMANGLESVKFSKGSCLRKRSTSLEDTINDTWENRSKIEREDNYIGRKQVFEIFELIEAGLLGPVAVNSLALSIAETRDEAKRGIVVLDWVKKALLLGLGKQFKMRWIDKTKGYRDFLPVFPMSWDEFENLEICDLDSRQAPPGARRGSRFAGVQSMPNTWINSGAVVGYGTMLDNVSVAASCAYIGKNCHISGKAGVGGVFEPLGAIPNVVGDNVFIGVGSEPTEGCIIGSGAVLAPKVVITSGTRIYDMRPGKNYGTYWYGFVPHDTLVVEATYQIGTDKEAMIIAGGCVAIRKNMDPSKRGKVDINSMLREM